MKLWIRVKRSIVRVVLNWKRSEKKLHKDNYGNKLNEKTIIEKNRKEAEREIIYHGIHEKSEKWFERT